ncbi:hypothetical protein [Novosphingobium sp. B1]|uniref:hypothetical protein n=1 Tax=Novosphingobium sp. B1 TaxID=1938756 RepID=UPI0009D7BA9C|nr:hypothetical protein [Novosphingobium sp. B1]SMC62787.1 hypothetical protein SAMN06272759_1058 [Novosphingobium sp. B1]
MRNPIDLLTPGHITFLGRVTAVVAAIALGFGYVSNTMTPAMAGVGSFFLACALLLAAPRQRATEMLGAVTVWQCFAEFLSTIQSGSFAMWRLGVAVATLGSVMAVIRVQHLRALSRQSPSTRLRDLDRRTIGGIGVLPPSSSQLAEMRQSEVA